MGDSRIGITVTDDQRERLDLYKAKHGLSLTQIVRSLLDTVPFDDDNVTPIVLKVPKVITGNPSALAAWLDVAVAEIKQHYTNF